jgi:hypothetical protein
MHAGSVPFQEIRRVPKAGHLADKRGNCLYMELEGDLSDVQDGHAWVASHEGIGTGGISARPSRVRSLA